MTRIVPWFSCGNPSAVAAKLTLTKYAASQHVDVVHIDTGSEHPDNERFLRDCEKWFGVPIRTLRSPEFEDTWAVWEKRRFLAGPKGAPCTTELKKAVRWAYERPDDIHVFGYTADKADAARFDRLKQENPDLRVAAPLILLGLTKADCHVMVQAAGIELPVMYRLGYRNNNCIGCVKGGAGYWNKIRHDFPEVFDRMARLERELGAKLIKLSEGRVSLDELRPDVGRYEEEDISCSHVCAAAVEYVS